MFCQWFPSDFLHVHHIVSPPKYGIRGTSWWPPGRACCAPWMGPPEPCCASAGSCGDSNGIPMGFQRIDVNCFFFPKVWGRSWKIHGVDHLIVEIPISMVQFFMLSEHWTHSNLSVILSWPYQLFHGPIFHMFPPCLGCLRFLDSHVLLSHRTPLRAEVHLSGRAAYHQHHSATWLKGRFAVQETMKHGGVSTIENGDVN